MCCKFNFTHPCSCNDLHHMPDLYEGLQLWRTRVHTSTLWHDELWTQSSYLDKLYQWQTCRDVTFPLHRRWCRGCRARENFPDPSRCPRCTPRTLCHGQARNCTACPGLQDIWCTVRTAVTCHSGSSHSCTRRWRRWSPCRAPSCGTDPSRLYRPRTFLCDWSFLRRFHLKGEGREWFNNS